MRRRIFKPYRAPGRRTFSVAFWHPLYKKQIKRGLGTRDPAEAETICADIRLLCEDPAFWKENSGALRAFHPTAKDAFYNVTPTPGPPLPTPPRDDDTLDLFIRVSRLVEKLKTADCDCVYQRIVGKNADVTAALFWSWPSFSYVRLTAEGMGSSERAELMDALMMLMTNWAATIREAARERKRLEAQLRMAREPQAPAVPAAPQRRRRGKRKA